MSDFVQQANIASLITPRTVAVSSVTAGGAGDATKVTSANVQRSLLKNPLSAAVVLAFSTTLAATRTLSFGSVKVRDSADGTTFADYAVFTDPGVVATGPGGGGTVLGQVTLPVNLRGARDYVLIEHIPDLSATGTDTAIIAASFVFSGFDRLPAPV